MTTTQAPATITVMCETCGDKHVAEYAYDSPHGGHRVYEAECPQDYLVDRYTIHAAI